MSTQSSGTGDESTIPIPANPYPAEEMRKLYAEILQLDNQRFLLTTTAVVLFGTVAGWATTALLRTGSQANPVPDATSYAASYLPLASFALLGSVLLGLYVFQLSKANTIRWLAAYLLLQGSTWEWTWYTFRSKVRGGAIPSIGSLPFYEIHRTSTSIFAIIMCANLGYFIALDIFVHNLSPLRSHMAWWILALIFVIPTIFWMYRRGREVLATDERVYMKEWYGAKCEGERTRAEWRP